MQKRNAAFWTIVLIDRVRETKIGAFLEEESRGSTLQISVADTTPYDGLPQEEGALSSSRLNKAQKTY